jgi:hypothetical protein
MMRLAGPRKHDERTHREQKNASLPHLRSFLSCRCPLRV